VMEGATDALSSTEYPVLSTEVPNTGYCVVFLLVFIPSPWTT